LREIFGADSKYKQILACEEYAPTSPGSYIYPYHLKAIIM